MTDTPDRPAMPMASDADDLAWIGSAMVTVRQRWLWILGCTCALLAAAVAYLGGTDATFSVVMRVSPTVSAVAGQDGDTSDAFGNFAGLNGNAIVATLATPYHLYREGLRSQAVAACLARDAAIMRGASRDGWWPDRGLRRMTDSIGTWLLAGLNGLAGAPVDGGRPSPAARLKHQLATRVTIVPDGKSPATLVTVDAVDPAFGRHLLLQMHRCADTLLRDRARDRLLHNIGHLTARLNSIADAEHRQVLVAILADQQRRLTIVDASDNYAAKPDGAVVASPYPTGPQPLPLMLAALGLGAGFGIVLVLVWPKRRPT